MMFETIVSRMSGECPRIWKIVPSEAVMVGILKGAGPRHVSPARQFERLPVVGAPEKEKKSILSGQAVVLHSSCPSVCHYQDGGQGRVSAKTPLLSRYFLITCEVAWGEGSQERKGDKLLWLCTSGQDNFNRKKGPANLTQTKQIAFSSTTGLRTLKVFLLNWLLCRVQQAVVCKECDIEIALQL